MFGYETINLEHAVAGMALDRSLATGLPFDEAVREIIQELKGEFD
ncbi:hypothetical protein [Effusibacillus pohliae]|nr:hypothetical protein [Effusibacillus pohliae]